MTEKFSVSETTWRYRELIIALGGEHEIIKKIEALGFFPPPFDTIKGWRTRGCIPGKWLPVVLKIAFDERALSGVDALFPETRP